MTTKEYFSFIPNPEQAIQIFKDRLTTNSCLNPRKVTKPLILYGAGNLGRMAKEYLDLIGCKFDAVIDKNAEEIKKDIFWEGIPIYSLSNTPKHLKKEGLVAVSVVTAPYTNIKNELSLDGWDDICPFYDIVEDYRDIHPLSNGWFAKCFGENDREKIEEVLISLFDDYSRAHYLQFLAWRRLREEWDFLGAPITTHDRFFIREVISRLGGNSSFIDAGAHTGSVIRAFTKVVSGKFNKIYAIEPDEKNLYELRNLTQEFPKEISEKIEIISSVLSSSRDERSFYFGLGYASQCSNLGSNIVTPKKLDELNLAPTFIKLHLEGHELEALKGSIDTIERSRPILAITSYHNHLGIWELPLWLKRHCLNYRIIMRLHGWCGTGAVLYAIPN